jgi:hypothetical protein
VDAPLDRRTALVLVLAAAAVVALGVAAATVDSAVDAGSGGLPSGGGVPSDDTEFGFGNTTETADQSDDDDRFALSAGSLPYCYPWLDTPLAIGTIVGAFVLVGAFAYRRTDTLLTPLAVVAAFGPPVFFAHTLLTLCSPTGGWSLLADLLADLRGPFVAGEGGGVGVGGSGVSAPTAALGVILFVALFAAVFLLFVASGDDESAAASGTDDAEGDDAESVEAVARAAGRAADRIEADADADNEIFRAWASMTDHLDVDRPRSSTPTEFARAAVDAGMDADDVRELTDLFAEVRYGGAAATADRESRAVDALRRIEAAYGGEE